MVDTLPEISVVIPCYHEEENAAAIAAAVIAVLEKADASFELIFIDNGSRDRTVPIIHDLCAADPRVKLIINTRNFGQMRSPTHGIYQARGRAVIAMCADFQDPPAMLEQFIARWRAGAKIVLAIRETERSALWTRIVRGVGYGFMARFADYAVIPNATGFGIYDREVVDCLARWNEPEPFFRGMLVESGYPIETIAFQRPQRAAGTSKNDFFRLLDFGLSGLSASSRKLLRLPFFLAVPAMGLAILSFLAAACLAIAGHPVSGLLWAAAFELQFGLLFLFLGLAGDQIRLMAERSRNMPLVIERERVNFTPEQR